MSEANNGYRATPIVEAWGDSGWKAGVLLSGGDDARRSTGQEPGRPAVRFARGRLAVR